MRLSGQAASFPFPLPGLRTGLQTALRTGLRVGLRTGLRVGLRPGPALRFTSPGLCPGPDFPLSPPPNPGLRRQAPPGDRTPVAGPQRRAPGGVHSPLPPPEPVSRSSRYQTVCPRQRPDQSILGILRHFRAEAGNLRQTPARFRTRHSLAGTLWPAFPGRNIPRSFRRRRFVCRRFAQV